MTRAELIALAERVEKAAGRSAALNQDIQRAINAGRRALAVPDYTASLDAAASLAVSRGYGYEAGQTPQMGVYAVVYRDARTRFGVSGAATPALALTAAALGAMAAEART